MSFVNVSLNLPREVAEILGDVLLESGALSVNIEDAETGTQQERPIFAEPGGDSGLWSLCRLTAMFSSDADTKKIVSTALSQAGYQSNTIQTETVEDTDWVKRNQEQFQPIQISDRLWIVPSWHSEPNGDALNIHLDPGAAFGTGSHPTTRLCLQWLEEIVPKSNHPFVLDYGCGSGILAIAAMKFGASKGMGVDIDQQAIETAIFNAAKNSVNVQFQTTDEPVQAIADVTVANILANPLKVLAPLLASKTRVGGYLALAGLLDHQAEDIRSIYSPWFDLAVWKTLDGWSCLAGERINR
jgi:ribosomal protein L11 methyltransferase